MRKFGPKTRDPVLVEAVLDLYATGLSSGLIAEQLNEHDELVQGIVYSAKKAGDPRAGKIGDRAKITKTTRCDGKVGGVKATVITTIVPARFDGPRQRLCRHIINGDAVVYGVLPFHEPAPGRSAHMRAR